MPQCSICLQDDHSLCVYSDQCALHPACKPCWQQYLQKTMDAVQNMPLANVSDAGPWCFICIGKTRLSWTFIENTLGLKDACQKWKSLLHKKGKFVFSGDLRNAFPAHCLLNEKCRMPLRINNDKIRRDYIIYCIHDFAEFIIALLHTLVFCILILIAINNFKTISDRIVLLSMCSVIVLHYTAYLIVCKSCMVISKSTRFFLDIYYDYIIKPHGGGGDGDDDEGGGGDNSTFWHCAGGHVFFCDVKNETWTAVYLDRLQSCPACGVIIEHNGGCYSMRCAACKNFFSWRSALL